MKECYIHILNCPYQYVHHACSVKLTAYSHYCDSIFCIEIPVKRFFFSLVRMKKNVQSSVTKHLITEKQIIFNFHKTDSQS